MDKVANFPPGYGRYVRIRHQWPTGDVYVTWYGHLSEIQVKEGDFVITISLPLLLRTINSGDVIVFDHAIYGRLLKRVLHFTANDQVFVIGANKNSLDSNHLGPINRDKIRGKVVWKITSRK